MSDAGVQQCSRAHDARLERDHQRAIVEAPASQCLGRVTQCQHFGVGRGILMVLTLVVPSRNDATLMQHDGTNRYVVVVQRVSRFLQRRAHRLDEFVAHLCHGGRGGIRTHGGLHLTRFPSVPIRPLSHPSKGCVTIYMSLSLCANVPRVNVRAPNRLLPDVVTARRSAAHERIR